MLVFIESLFMYNIQRLVKLNLNLFFLFFFRPVEKPEGKHLCERMWNLNAAKPLVLSERQKKLIYGAWLG